MSKRFKIIAIFSALLLGPVLSQLIAQSDCNKGQGTSAARISGSEIQAGAIEL